MSKFLNALIQTSEGIDASRAPLDTLGGHATPSFLTKTLEEIDQLVRRDTAPFHLSDLPAYVNAVIHITKGGIDDRALLLEKLLVLLSRLPDDSTFSKQLERFLIDTLYKDLPHPPSAYVAYNSFPPLPPPISVDRSITYAFRSSDGTDYNPLFPSLGKARSPYARSVPSSITAPLKSLPDPGLVFDTLLKRGDSFVDHPAGISSLFFAFADLVIHSIFDTDHQDWALNNASSYLDLSPLYGSSAEAVDSVRRKDGTGKLWEDVFADSRLLLMPPSTCALLVLLCRNHNYIASKILNMNERGNLKNPPPVDEPARRAQDDEIFHRARLVNSGYFMQIILGDYVGAILGLTRDGVSWRLDPRETMRRVSHEFCPQGEGNVVSIEFNLLYRWHATLSEPDTRWIEAEFRRLFNDTPFNQITPQDFAHVAMTQMMPQGSVRGWTFNGLKRDGNGRFNNDDIATILQNATNAYAGAFRARGTPEVLRVVEIMGILQARSWGTCSLNEFRKFMGLKPYDNFKEWNPAEDIYRTAEGLYGDIDNLELHVGLQAEEAKKPMPGAGLCPGYTISRAILADAVSLTRGDRFMTVDFTPYNFTTWGYRDCQFNPHDGSYGGMLTKLLFRHLPDHYPAGSAFAHFPFLVPARMKDDMAKRSNDSVKKYIWTRPERPMPIRSVTVDTHAQVSRLLEDTRNFDSNYEKRLANLTDGVVIDHELVRYVLLSDDNLRKWGNSFFDLAKRLIDEHPGITVGSELKYIDIVKDVINLIPVYWIVDEIVGLPIKTPAHPRGECRPQELYNMFADVCNYVFLNFDPADDWTLHGKARKTTDKVLQYTKAHLLRLSKGNLSIEAFSDSILRFINSSNDRSDAFLKQLLEAGNPNFIKELAASLFAEVITTAALWSKAITHIVHFFLEDGRSAARETASLGGQHEPENNAQLFAYAYEALRLDPIVPIVQRVAVADVSLPDLPVHANERVIASISNCNLDLAVYGPSPQELQFNRLIQEGPGWGVGDHGLVSRKFFEATAPQVLRAIFSINGISRGPGESGKLNRFVDELHGLPLQSYVDADGAITPWPPSLVVQCIPNTGA